MLPRQNLSLLLHYTMVPRGLAAEAQYFIQISSGFQWKMSRRIFCFWEIFITWETREGKRRVRLFNSAWNFSITRCAYTSVAFCCTAHCLQPQAKAGDTSHLSVSRSLSLSLSLFVYNASHMILFTISVLARQNLLSELWRNVIFFF